MANLKLLDYSVFITEEELLNLSEKEYKIARECVNTIKGTIK